MTRLTDLLSLLPTNAKEDSTYDLGIFYKKPEKALICGTENISVKVSQILKENALTTEEREKNG